MKLPRRLAIGAVVFLTTAACLSPDEAVVYRKTWLQPTDKATGCLPRGARVRDAHNTLSTKTVRWVTVVSTDRDSSDCTGVRRAQNGETGIVIVDDLTN